MEVSHLFVCLMGMGVTFFGLICLILMTVAIGKVIQRLQPPAPAAPQPAAAPAEVPGNRQEIIAAVAACIAEDLDTDVSAIRILSFRKVS